MCKDVRTLAFLEWISKWPCGCGSGVPCLLPAFLPSPSVFFFFPLSPPREANRFSSLVFVFFVSVDSVCLSFFVLYLFVSSSSSFICFFAGLPPWLVL